MKPNTFIVYSSKPKGKFYIDARTLLVRRRWWTKARVPGTVRKSRMPGGCSFRNNWEG